ncbi:MAG: A/G-specific adenine glycosylase [Flavobacteriaceae bacterium]|nr:A/G-specific adenine glycosylase [Flavobacteriaceae bacterium]|tara:strand:- start:17969 stop:19018 length:1050 start_codon:yes stop_codon:yes gene_type:complete
MNFSKALLSWYELNHRPLPWRKTKDPYKIWLSEIILQQTRVEQGIPYYNKLINEFPTIFDLAKAEEAKVLKIWQGLGYYKRAENLHLTAKNIVLNFAGKFPSSQKELKNLKGIGDYTASAISSICFNKNEAVVDGNVFRVLGRIFGINIPINSNKSFKHFKSKANDLMKGAPPGTYNQALMDFGAIQCKPKNPNCKECVFSKDCYAYKENKVTFLPVTNNKIKVKTRYFNYLVFQNPKKQTVLEQRVSKGIWHKLFEFPVIESKREIKNPSTKFNSKIKLYSNEPPTKIFPLSVKPINHKLTHQKIVVKFWNIKLSRKSSLPVNESDLSTFPVPVVIENFITQHYNRGH